MARPNYSKMSTAKIKEKNEEIKVSVEETILEKTTSPSEEPTVVEEPDIKEKVIGIVANCQRLNVRKGPSKSTEVECIIEAGKEVEIIKQVNDSWYSVAFDDNKGYCMKKFIEIKS